jgi:hypothetical protein
MQLERKTTLPLRVGHLEEIDLRHRAGDIEKGVDPPEGGKRLIDHDLSGRRLGEIEVDDERLCARGLHRFRRALQVRAVSRDENERGEITRKTNGRRSANPLACARDDGD